LAVCVIIFLIIKSIGKTTAEATAPKRAVRILKINTKLTDRQEKEN